MRSKTILSIAAFSIAFIFSSVFAGLFIDKSEYQSNSTVSPSFNSQPTSCFKYRGGAYTADKIEAFLKQDDDYGRERFGRLYQVGGSYRSPVASSSFAEYAKATSEYADNSGSLDDGGLPQEFQIVWRKHMKAWRDYASFLNDAGKMGMDNSEFFRLNRVYNRDIGLTWKQVLSTSEKNGATIPANYR